MRKVQSQLRHVCNSHRNPSKFTHLNAGVFENSHTLPMLKLPVGIVSIYEHFDD